MTLYQLIGTDGRHYGPASADQVRQWIREHRLERQTPVFVPGSTDWTFLGLLPEFAGAFLDTAGQSAPPLLQPASPAFIAPLNPMRSESMAKAGLICGILAVTVCCCCGGLPFSLLGLIFSMIALVQFADNPQKYGGQGMAIVGLLLSLCGFLVLCLGMFCH